MYSFHIKILLVLNCSFCILCVTNPVEQTTPEFAQGTLSGPGNKTYINEHLDFQLTAPSHWSIRVSNSSEFDSTEGFLAFLSLPESDQSKFPSKVNLYAYPEPEQLICQGVLDSLLNIYQDDPAWTGIINLGYNTTTLGGKTACESSFKGIYKFETSPACSLHITQAYLSRYGFNIVFTFISTEANLTNHASDFLSIRSSIKFF